MNKNGGGVKPYSPLELPLGTKRNPQPVETLTDEQAGALLSALQRGLEAGAAQFPKTFHVLNVTIPAAAVSFLVRLPDRYDALTLIFFTQTNAGFRFGPEAASIPLPTFRGQLTIPGTTNALSFDNPGAAYAVTILGVRGHAPATIVSWP